MAENELKLVVQAHDYFRELVTEAIGNQRLAVQPETEFYLVNLLNQFMTSDKLYVQDSHGNLKDEPLVFLLKEALEAPQPEAQKLLYRYVGDVSLYRAGFFRESLGKRLVDVDYYVGMGGNAYSQVAARTEEQRRLFEELSHQFSAFVDVLGEISEKTTTTQSETDLLRFYEMWNRSGSERAAKVLEKAGILPVRTDNRRDEN